jgi:hypothetical protein
VTQRCVWGLQQSLMPHEIPVQLRPPMATGANSANESKMEKSLASDISKL